MFVVVLEHISCNELLEKEGDGWEWKSEIIYWLSS